VYSKTISKGVEKQLQYRHQLHDSMRNGKAEERTDTLRAYEDVRLAVKRGLMPMPEWLAEMDRQREAVLKMTGTSHASKAKKVTKKRARVAEKRFVAQSSLADMAARLERAWRG
jgi:hypothetical protein